MQRRRIDPDRLAELRRARQLDQTEFAVRLRRRGLGTTPSTVSRWENGQQEPYARALPAIASELGVTIDELYEDEEDELVRALAVRIQEAALRLARAAA